MTKNSHGLLDSGHTLVTDMGEQVTVDSLLGSGGQGEVYRVRTLNGSSAVKWYFPQHATESQHDILVSLVDREWQDDRFLWPQRLVRDPASLTQGFGYLMDLRQPRFHDLPELFRREIRTKYRVLVTAALHTVEAYRELHQHGIVYRDISWGNIFFDPANGDVLVCDNDNAVAKGTRAGIAGTPQFMAPELVRGGSDADPSIETDLHALAVLLFFMLTNHHPLEGAAALRIHCMDENAMRQLHGTRPVFIFDPDDTSNAPVQGEHNTVLATWAALPKSLKALFTRTFTEGLRNPGARVREGEWQSALSRVRDELLLCGSCGKQNLTEPGAASPGSCWSCGKDLVAPARLTVKVNIARVPTVHTLRLGAEAELYEHHLRDHVDRHTFHNPVGVVTAHPSQPGTWGLTNRSPRTWTVRNAMGKEHQVPPQRTAAIKPGASIDFGSGAQGSITPE